MDWFLENMNMELAHERQLTEQARADAAREQAEWLRANPPQPNTVRWCLASGDIAGARAAFEAGEYGYASYSIPGEMERTMGGTPCRGEGRLISAREQAERELRLAEVTQRPAAHAGTRRMYTWTAPAKPADDVRGAIVIAGSQRIPGAADSSSDVDVFHTPDVPESEALQAAAEWAAAHGLAGRPIDATCTTKIFFVPGFRPDVVELRGSMPLVHGRGEGTDIRRAGLVRMGVPMRPDGDVSLSEWVDTSGSVFVASARRWLARHTPAPVTTPEPAPAVEPVPVATPEPAPASRQASCHRCQWWVHGTGCAAYAAYRGVPGEIESFDEALELLSPRAAAAVMWATGPGGPQDLRHENVDPGSCPGFRSV